MTSYRKLIQDYSAAHYRRMTRKPAGQLKYPFLVPGSASYLDSLWDWDSFFADIAIRQIQTDRDDLEEKRDILPFEQGCILNFLDHQNPDGSIPMCITETDMLPKPGTAKKTNMHKPCLIQHALFISRQASDAEWLRPHLGKLSAFLDWYRRECRHAATGLYFWIDDLAIGVDNDPCTFYRPDGSSASVYLNVLMYKELEAYIRLCGMLGLPKEDYAVYEAEAEAVREAVNTHLWDERNGFYYSADLNLRPVDPSEWLHSGMPRHWDCLIQRIDVWSGILPLWAGIADGEKAGRMVYENLLRQDLFNADYGIRTLSPKEKMYCLAKSNNPSCWLGPVWGISNYLSFRALVKGGFRREAEMLAEKTVLLLGKDLEENGTLHEYYNPDTGEGLYNPDFQNWNLLANNMIAWLEGRDVVEEP